MKTVIMLPGITRSYHFLHAADFHLARYIGCDTHEISRYEKSIGEWSYKDLTPLKAFTNALKTFSSDNADAMLLGGDILDYLNDQTIDYLNDIFSLQDGKCVWFVPGNHERSGTENERETFTKIIPREKCYWVRDLGDIQILGVDNADREISAEQYSFIRESLGSGKPTIILMHIPVYTDDLGDAIANRWGEENNSREYFTIGFQNDAMYTQAFCDLLRSKDSNIVAILAGHVHFYHKSQICDGRFQYTCPPGYKGELQHIVINRL